MKFKEIAELTMYIVTAFGAPIAALWALIQWGSSLKQRKIEFRWRQADLGRQLLDQLYDEPTAGIALELIDGELESIKTQEGEIVPVDENTLRIALSESKDISPGPRQARRAFDSLLYYLERFENMINLNLIKQEDIAMPTKYYCDAMKPYMDIISPYAIDVGYRNALNLIKRLQSQ